MTEEQVKQLESDKTRTDRVAIHAPMSGTVIEKMTEVGQYIKAGTPVYKLADLSSVWLVLELFPEDASVIEIGQRVAASTQSMNGQSCEGRVEFVEPTVDPNMQTVGIRVAIDNQRGRLRPGEFTPRHFENTLTIKGRAGSGNRRCSTQQPAVDRPNFSCLRGGKAG